MKRILTILLCATVFCGVLRSQEDLSKRPLPLPSVDVKTMNGVVFNTKEINNDGKPIIICFFATWCKPCMIELSAIADEYEDWKAETGVKIYAVSIDDPRSSAKVAPLVNGKGWEYEILLDVNSEFKRAMNVGDIPHTFVLNGNKEIVWQHASYSPGVENEYIEVVKKLIAGENK
ncbi:MAG: TlpA family protein disulfide reductase [Bacteroidales bacterium]|jgi:peroxiredoxin|nr:TlpA family protein disulfide reductase [Bacteroidales bacterium]